MKSNRHATSYDNRGAEPHRPWPEQRRRGNVLPIMTRAIVALVVIATAVEILRGCVG